MNIKRCQACGIEKDMDIEEYYPYSEDMITQEDKVQPLFDLECQMDEDQSDFRVATVCFSCYHKLEPDMWINESMWKALNPIVDAKDLPDLPNDSLPT